MDFKELEEKGVVLERTLRGEDGETVTFVSAVSGRKTFADLEVKLVHPPDDSGSPEMIEQWIELVLKKNSLVSEESDLMVA